MEVSRHYPVACAEIVRYYLPKLVDIHNYSQANSLNQKLYNWKTLNKKVFRRLGYETSDEIITCIVNCKPGYIEYLLFGLRAKIEEYNDKATRLPALPSKSLQSIHKLDTTIKRQTKSVYDPRNASLHNVSQLNFQQPTPTHSQVPPAILNTRNLDLIRQSFSLQDQQDRLNSSTFQQQQQGLPNGGANAVYNLPQHQHPDNSNTGYRQSNEQLDMGRNQRGSTTSLHSNTSSVPQRRSSVVLPAQPENQSPLVYYSSGSGHQDGRRASQQHLGGSQQKHAPMQQKHGSQQNMHLSQQAMQIPQPSNHNTQMLSHDGTIDNQQLITEMRETIQILQLKVGKLDELLMLKDARIHELESLVGYPTNM